MKKALISLAFVYLLLSTLMLIIGVLATISLAKAQKGGLFIVFVGIAGILIPAICAACSVRYLKMKTEASAYGISILSGVLAFCVANAIAPKSSTTPPDTWALIGLSFSIFVGVFTHKVFYKYIKHSYEENGA